MMQPFQSTTTKSLPSLEHIAELDLDKELDKEQRTDNPAIL